MASGTGTKKDAFKTYGTATGLANNLTSNAANIYGGLEPTLAAEAAHPMGYTPQQKSAINTAAQQSAGGSNAGAAGQGGLYAARTRNAGAGQAAIGKSTRAAGQNLSKAALGTEIGSANLANQRQQEGLKGLQGLYGTNIGEGENALGLSNQALGIAKNNPSFWQKFAGTASDDVLKALTSPAGGGG